MLILTSFCVLVFITQGIALIAQGGKITDLNDKIKDQNKRIQTLEEILSKHDASLGIKIELGKHRYDSNKDPAVKRFMEKIK